MSAAAQIKIASESKTLIWTGRVVSTLVVLFLLFDAITKIIQERHVIAASIELGYPPNSMVLIGALLLACTILYVIPRTAILGAILLTGYLGGAVATQVRVNHPLFERVFPVIFGVLAWGAIFVREPRLRALLPLRK